MLITQQELAERWNISPSTLQKWRVQGKGPAYYKLGRLVRYGIAEILDYERRHRTQCMSEAPEQCEKLLSRKSAAWQTPEARTNTPGREAVPTGCVPGKVAQRPT